MDIFNTPRYQFDDKLYWKLRNEVEADGLWCQLVHKGVDEVVMNILDHDYQVIISGHGEFQNEAMKNAYENYQGLKKRANPTG